MKCKQESALQRPENSKGGRFYFSVNHEDWSGVEGGKINRTFRCRSEHHIWCRADGTCRIASWMSRWHHLVSRLCEQHEGEPANGTCFCPHSYVHKAMSDHLQRGPHLTLLGGLGHAIFKGMKWRRIYTCHPRCKTT